MIKKYIFMYCVFIVCSVRADFIAINKTGTVLKIQIQELINHYYRNTDFVSELQPNERKTIVIPSNLDDFGLLFTVMRGYKDPSEGIFSYHPYTLSAGVALESLPLLKNAKLYMPTVTIMLDADGYFVISSLDPDNLKKEIERVKAEVKKEAQRKLSAPEYQELTREFTQEEATAPIGQGGKVKVSEPLRGLLGEYLVSEDEPGV